jgi:hypothetical protein
VQPVRRDNEQIGGATVSRSMRSAQTVALRARPLRFLSEEEIMYVTVRRYEGVTNAGEAAREVEKTFLPLVSDIPGFAAYYWVDAGGGVMLSTSVLATKAGADVSNRRAAGVVRETLASVLPKPPQITEGEVVVHKTA